MDRDYRHKYVDVDGVKTHYVEAGQGDTFVLVHGGLAWCCGELTYGDVIGPLSKDFHVVAPDNIGYGETLARGQQDYPSEVQGAFLVRFIEKLGVGPVFLAGNSHGGYLAQYVAHDRPDLVRKLVIISSLDGTVPYPSPPEGLRYIYGPGGHQWGEKPTMEGLRKYLKGFYAHKDLVTDERVKRTYETYLRTHEFLDRRGKAVSCSLEAARQDLTYKGKHMSELAGQLKMPVLLTWSEPGSKIEWGLSHFCKIPGCEMHIFPWTGHHAQTDQRDRWVQVVTNFLKNKPVRPPS